jgi:hypothetical protein
LKIALSKGQCRVLLPSTELAERLICAERDCYVDWIRTMEMLPGNPFDVEVRTFGSATAIVCGAVPAQIWNRVFNFTPADEEHIPAILNFYAAHKAQVMFDLSPYSVPQFWAGRLTYTLAKNYGLFQGACHHMLYGEPTKEVPTTPDHISIVDVDPTDCNDFKWIYEQVWGNGTEIAVLAGQSNFRCYTAYVDQRPAALGVLHVANGVASMANGLTILDMRGRGCQTALLYHRIKQAALEGCNLLVSQCSPGTISQYNQLKVGFKIAGTKTWWIPVESM